MFRVILACFICLAIGSHSVWAQIPDYNVSQVISIIEEMKKRCPPQECLFVGIGRSPTIFTSAMRLQDGLEVVDIPLTGFRYVAKPEHEIPRMTYMLGRDKRDILYAHFDNYLPKELTKKKIMLIDFSVSGGSIASASDHMELFLKDYRKLSAPPELSVFVLTGDDQQIKYIEELFDYRKITHRHILGLDSAYPDIYRLLYDQEFDDLARHGSFNIRDYYSVADYQKKWVKDSNLENNRKLQRSLLEQINSDPELGKRFPVSCASNYL